MFEVYDVMLIPLILGLVELFKGLGLKRKFLPVVSVVLGLGAGIFYVYPEDVKGGILFGLMLGLSASGLYSGTKNTLDKSSEK
ncbi:hypothetical protein ACFFIS_16735 [Virgibacillus soli]|uniref:Holin n=1 Tax=Paracerasibacillus soli TaxID=480284 RepID=A0ABU5CVL9_9BACI|nr:hypothetical protein [Virgibacillus soli]MDY0410371.1 hypothetical protein [Virgibacillus soli]